LNPPARNLLHVPLIIGAPDEDPAAPLEGRTTHVRRTVVVLSSDGINEAPRDWQRTRPTSVGSTAHGADHGRGGSIC
jgi:hypothetical protein